ncbi:polyol transporter 5 [Cinnamomum micranthum f. kanehirae]|uniref:Polyol transporter 5 n=1 Tax=Cinnamomum micranthum f. kanehirae TaxID=337451 RepID=A0A443Q1L1_9MAGN|nr:polyol transporter 5 [Cinnamomum micranthum f. kanehirae]
MSVQNVEKCVTSDARGTQNLAMVMEPAMEKSRKNKFAFACSMLASMTSILLGYGVLTGAILFIKNDLKLDDTKVEVLMGSIGLYSLIGSLAAGRTSDWIGRRYTIILAAMIFFVGALTMGFATNYALLMAGRLIEGIGVGYALMIAPVYTAEVSPSSSRGFLTSFSEVFESCLGMSPISPSLAFPNHINWRLMLGGGAIPSVILAISVLTMPESPRWLVMQGRLDEAKRVLDKTSESKQEAEIRLSDIKDAAGIPQHCTDDIVPIPKRSHGEGVWKELLIRPSPSVRRILIAAVGIQFFQQASGVILVVLYSPSIFKKAGIKSKNGLLGATVAVGFTKTIFILVATFLVDRFGRRPLLLTSTTGMILSLLGLGTGLTIIDHNSDKKLMGVIALCIMAVLTLVASFSIGLGPITWVYSSEIIPLRLRAQGMSLAVAINCVTGGVLSMTFLSLYKAISIGGTFFLFAGVSTLSWIFFYSFLPETKGRTLEEMETIFGKKEEEKSHGQLQVGTTATTTPINTENDEIEEITNTTIDAASSEHG